ncbi:MAG: hypothetical protein LQ341_006382 [Variospora aurantia]|nr:MAG: hypothetical protein LQ341_006382 [Variospora aurantia]
MVLRPTDDGSFLVVGECYVQGLMDGEALLGLLPSNWRRVLRFDEEAKDIASQLSKHLPSGLSSHISRNVFILAFTAKPEQPSYLDIKSYALRNLIGDFDKLRAPDSANERECTGGIQDDFEPKTTTPREENEEGASLPDPCCLARADKPIIGQTAMLCPEHGHE